MKRQLDIIGFTALAITVSMLVLISPVYSQNGGSVTYVEIPDTCRMLDFPYDSLQVDSNFRDIVHDAFGVGEYLKFEIGYGFIKAGFAEMKVDSLFDFNGRLCYMISTDAQSYSFFDKFYKVRDHGETWLDAYGLFPWHFEKHLREGGYKSDVWHDFDQYRGIVYDGGDTIVVDEYIHDVLSSLYYVRTLDLNVGDRVHIRNFSKKNCFDLEVIVHDREEIKVDAGRFMCLKVEPLLQSAGLFKHEGELTVWMTDDRLKMPVLMKSKVLVGSISAELIDYRIGELID